MQVHVRLIGRIAGLGLGAAFIALIACSLWATERIQGATDHATAAISLSDLYADVGRRWDVQQNLARRHRLDFDPNGWDKQLAATVATHATLMSISQASDVDDRDFAKRMLKMHQAYFEMLLELYSAEDSGSPMLATIVEEKKAEPLFIEAQSTIAKRAAYQHGQALEALADLTSTQRVNVRTIFFTTVLGLFEFWVGIIFFAMYQRKMEQSRRTEIASFEHASRTDNLTGLGNHRAFQEELDAQLARAKRHGGFLSLAVLDIDEFKGINDRSGHLYGDRVLAAMGALLGEVRKSDRSFRIGGDEFAIVLPDTQTLDAAIMMERIRQAAPTRLLGATLSIGIATTAERDVCDAIHLRAQADAALYAGKQSGRDTVMTYADAERGQLVLSPNKAQALRDLLRDGQVDVVFQPIWDAHQGVPFGYEALARPAAHYGLAGPQEAFEIAERLGRGPALDAVCLNAILARASEAPADSLIFVNIVPETLARNMFSGDALVEAVRDAGITPEQVVIELTERAMSRLDVIVREAKRLQSLGFKLALDDTGAGNAGLEVLRHLAVDFVKIDRAVVIQAMTDQTARAIIASIVVIAQSMGACVIAEGIETTNALDFVLRDVMLGWQRDSGIRGVQGYLLGRPAHAPWTGSTFDEHAAFMREHSEPGRLLAGKPQ
jgi:diguanylate cyclase (GGDEF)-like protein